MQLQQLTKNNQKRFITKLCIILCLSIFGCNPYPECDNSKSYPYWTEWSYGELISIVDDSLAILATSKNKKECSSNYEQEVNSRNGLFLVNYRDKKKPLLGDTLIYDLNYDSPKIVKNHFSDSSVLVFHKQNNKFGFWKVGAKFINLNNYSYSEDSKPYSDTKERAFYWINGNIFIKALNQIQVLDTNARQIKHFDFSGENEWLSKCSVFSYIENNMVCIRENKLANNFVLVVNDSISDTISFKNGIHNLLGNYVASKENNEMLKIHKIDTENFKFDNDFMPIWINEPANNNPAKFYKDKYNISDFVSYFGYDLVE